MFNFDISTLSYIFAGAAIATALFTLLYAIRPLARVSADKKCEPEDSSSPLSASRPGKCLKISVIAYDCTSSEHIDEYLEAIMRQDYPNFEVVLVEDATADGAETVAKKYSALYPNLYVTFIPPGSHNLSRRKLAYTLGIKGASGDVVLTTSTNAYPASDSWLSGIMEPFNSSTMADVVLGYAHTDFSRIDGFSRWYRLFDTTMTDAWWIGYAQAGKPYRGEGNNLAFRRHLFFDKKGYASTSFLQYGDDDLFVSQLAHETHVCMVLSPQTIVTTDWGESAARIWNDTKERYNFTRRWLRKGPFLRAGLFSLCQWIMLLCCLACALLSLPNILPAIFASALLIAFFTLEILSYRNAAAAMGLTRLWWSWPLFMLMRPIINLWFHEAHRHTRVKNFTWQRH